MFKQVVRLSVMVLCLAVLLAPLAMAEDGAKEFISHKKCKMCHMKIYKSWQKTSHATALETLKPGAAPEARKKAGLDLQKDYTQDATCLGCHTTGPDQHPGIQCEACHGAGKAYCSLTIMNRKKWKADPEKHSEMAVSAGLQKEPDEKTCTKCHNDTSPTYEPFDFSKRVEEIKHPE